MPYGPKYNYAIQTNMISTPYYLKLDSFIIPEAAVKCLNLVSFLLILGTKVPHKYTSKN